MNTKLKILAAFVILIGVGMIGCTPFGANAIPNNPPPTLTSKPRSTPRPSPCTEIKDAKGVSMCLVPAGKFTMGSNDTGPDHFMDASYPAHPVSLDAFYIDEYEVTNALYKNCVDAGGCSLPGDVSKYNNSQFANHPVVFVDWDQATAYCAWRGASTDLGPARLPSEAEWEKAARGSKEDIYPWGNDEPNKDLANYGLNAGDTTAVGSYESGKSPFGVYDMAGNVWEWVNDWYELYPGANPSRNPDFGKIYRVARGGSWNFDAGYMNVSFRNWGHTDYKGSNYGIRCARSAASH
jgi:serine/threonine-protein kinase